MERITQSSMIGSLLWIIALALCLQTAAADETSSLSVFADAAEQGNPAFGRWREGPVYATAASDDHVFFGSGGVIRVLRIDKGPGQYGPVWSEVARLETNGVVRDLVVRDNLLFVADDGGALRVVDITDPTELTEIGHVELDNFVRGLSVENDHAFLATGWQGMVVVDISDPTDPKKVHSEHGIGYILDVHVSDGRAVVADNKSGVKLFDVRDPLKPALLGAASVPGRAHGVHLENDLAFVVSLENQEGTQVGGLAIVDFSKPEKARQISFAPLNYGAERVWVEGGHAYLAGVVTDAGLIVFDVSDPSVPSRLGAFTHPTCSESITVRNGFAYLSHGDLGLEIIDLSQPTTPSVIQHVEAAGHVRGMHVVEDMAYVANGYTGLRLLDVSDPQNVKEVSHLPTYRALDVRTRGSFAYVADDWAGMVVADVSDPGAPRTVAFLDTPGYAEAISLEEDRAYVADGDGGLRVIDIANPYRPFEASAQDTEGYAYDVYVNNRVVYLADGKSGLRVYLAAHNVPVEISRFTAQKRGFEVRGVDGSGRYAYLAASYAGLIVLDMSDPRKPREVSSLDIATGARSVEVEGNRAYVGDRRGVTEVDISDPEKPKKLSYWPLPANADRIWSSGPRIYVAAREAGLVILDPSLSVK